MNHHVKQSRVVMLTDTTTDKSTSEADLLLCSLVSTSPAWTEKKTKLNFDKWMCVRLGFRLVFARFFFFCSTLSLSTKVQKRYLVTSLHGHFAPRSLRSTVTSLHGHFAPSQIAAHSSQIAPLCGAI